MNIIKHPDSFKDGVRVLLLTSRNKDGAKKKKNLSFVTKSQSHFDRQFKELVSISEDGDRLYSTAAPRSTIKAIRKFKERQLENDYNSNVENFYLNLNARWASCLSAPSCVVKKEDLWLLDCDKEDDLNVCKQNIAKFYDRDFVYWYQTKNGSHCLIKPFNSTNCTEEFKVLIHKNPMMLWGY